ncbi:uncharacterized protein LOC130674347 [Microplitis mediator]|uniref:uncharacterized protein LOC130674347 n=1 Tax=Microplitis mediator TaxID=375433 RepID=UPI0025563014|nr:uncharacterized protein LOC130674347 [Microplitis mediator]
MALKKFDTCCCCLDLKTGVLVIGILSIVLSIGGLIQAPIAYNNACSGFRTPDNNLDCRKASSQLGMSISSEVIGIILMALMIYGNHKENYRLLLPVIILQAIGIAIITIVIWYLSIILFMVSVGYGLVIFLIGNAMIGLCIYLWLVIYSRCQEIRTASYAAANTA